MKDFWYCLFACLVFSVAYFIGWASGYTAKVVDLNKEINGTVTNCQKVNDFDIYVCKPTK